VAWILIAMMIKKNKFYLVANLFNPIRLVGGRFILILYFTYIVTGETKW